MASTTVDIFADKLFQQITEAGFTLNEADEINKIVCSRIAEIGMVGLSERYDKPICDLVGL